MEKNIKSYLDDQSLTNHKLKEVSQNTLQEVDEINVWRNFQEGSEEALIYIYRKYVNVLYNYGCQICKNQELVQDCIQELFCDLIKSREKLGVVISIKGYLFKSLKRRVVKGLKKEKLLFEIEPSDLLEISFAQSVTSISQIPNSEQTISIKKYLDKLTLQQREILMLYFYEGLSYQEIADMFEVKVKSIRTQTYRALNSLSKLMLPFKDFLSLLILIGIDFLAK